MTTRSIFRLAIAAAIVTTLAGLVACKRNSTAPELTNGEKSAQSLPNSAFWSELGLASATESNLSANEPSDPHALRTRVYSLPYEIANALKYRAQPPPVAVDPFAPDTRKRELDPSQITDRFSELGVTFPEGSSATFNEETSELIVTHNLAALTQIEVILNEMNNYRETLFHARIEVFQLPAPLVLELSDSAAPNANHRPEWLAVLKIVERGEASIAACIAVQGRSGTRAKAEASSEFIFVADYKNDEKTGLPEPVFETRQVGTIFEVECIIGPDRKALYINFALEYHSAPPGKETVAFRFPGSDRTSQMQAPIFYSHRIQTEITTTSGSVVMIGSWRPTGRPEFERGDLMHVAFLKTDINTTGGVQRIR